MSMSRGQQTWCDPRADGHSPDEREREVGVAVPCLILIKARLRHLVRPDFWHPPTEVHHESDPDVDPQRGAFVRQRST